MTVQSLKLTLAATSLPKTMVTSQLVKSEMNVCTVQCFSGCLSTSPAGWEPTQGHRRSWRPDTGSGQVTRVQLPWS